jgi:uncharacterized protein YerC
MGRYTMPKYMKMRKSGIEYRDISRAFGESTATALSRGDRDLTPGEYARLVAVLEEKMNAK